MSLNKAMLIGNVGKDPEVRYLENNPSGNNGNPTKVASFPLATTERYRDRNGEQRENTEWHNIVVWRGLADIVEKYVHKGSQLYIEGRIRTRSWTDQTGNKHYTTEIVADSLQLLGKRESGQGMGQNPGQPYQAAPGQPYQAVQAQPYQAAPAQPYQASPVQAASPMAGAPAEENDDLPF